MSSLLVTSSNITAVLMLLRIQSSEDFDLLSQSCSSAPPSEKSAAGSLTFVAGRSLISSFRLPMEVLQRITASSLLFT